ncbi:MAG TPA: tRNA (adenosine(37)-N6)-threonylcarbamoyltransferase complex ATPase subunit type 1 TsaE [Bryobacteraceae bacterium]|nr:tRNA (adenosine(37)-N6)-threonylcarbamoyltransferase complex ATPase subunit type 1 TsaE [Bryobacteraceae bacterium]
MSAARYHTSSEEETIALGQRLAAEILRPALLLLIGNLGAGKTTLTKGIVQGLGVASPDDVSSPTFTLIHEYGSAVYHVDLYRLDSAQQIASLGLDDLFDQNSIVMIEWGERWRELFPAGRIEISLEATGGERDITVERFTP